MRVLRWVMRVLRWVMRVCLRGEWVGQQRFCRPSRGRGWSTCAASGAPGPEVSIAPTQPVGVRGQTTGAGLPG